MFRRRTARSSKMLVTTYMNARRHVPHVSNLQSHGIASLMLSICYPDEGCCYDLHSCLSTIVSGLYVCHFM
jgi:hypothetical protein